MVSRDYHGSDGSRLIFDLSFFRGRDSRAGIGDGRGEECDAASGEQILSVILSIIYVSFFCSSARGLLMDPSRITSKRTEKHI